MPIPSVTAATATQAVPAATVMQDAATLVSSFNFRIFLAQPLTLGRNYQIVRLLNG